MSRTYDNDELNDKFWYENWLYEFANDTEDDYLQEVYYKNVGSWTYKVFRAL